MTTESVALVGSALAIGCVHNLAGPDHYVPFVAMSRLGAWSTRRTLWVTVLCGLGHVLGSVALGMVGIAMGLTLRWLVDFEAGRGELAGWLLLGFGVALLLRGLYRARRGNSEGHVHRHMGGRVHVHLHEDEAHRHGSARGKWTPWILFVVFVFGPCEALIPLLMFPAYERSLGSVVMVSACFGVATIATMVAMVLVARAGVGLFAPRWGGRYAGVVAGAIVTLCGIAVVVGL